MKRLTLSLLLWAAATTAASAQYCAMYSDGLRSCGIPSFQMCLQSVAGLGGNCVPDYTTSIPPNLMQRSRDAARDSAPAGTSAARRGSTCATLAGGDACRR